MEVARRNVLRKACPSAQFLVHFSAAYAFVD